jgi:glycosyltransferase involved in cell wall biosynthesis
MRAEWTAVWTMAADAGSSGEIAPGRTVVPVSVVVCARNRASSIGRCLESVFAGRPAEVIVVDGLSTDGTATIARRSGAVVVSDDGRGLGAARERGAELASQDDIVFVDADATILPDTLEALYLEAHESVYDAIQARLECPPGPLTYWQSGEIWRRGAQERPGRATVLGCQATLIRRALVRRVGFDPVFTGAAEDHDFFFRARAAGAVLGHSARAVAYHEDRASLREFMSQRFWYGRGMARLVVRHRRLADQVGNARKAMRRKPARIPFMSVSWSLTALGMAAELTRVALDADLRRRLRRRSI